MRIWGPIEGLPHAISGRLLFEPEARADEVEMGLRVTGGQLRGRGLVSPRGRDVRPTSARVRESLFSILGQDLSGYAVLDLFAGAGTFGVEAASRGASSVVFVEQDRHHARTTAENAGLAEELAEVSVLVMSAERALQKLAREGHRFDLVFLDPPYGVDLARTTLERVADLGEQVLAAQARVVIESDEREELPATAGALLRDSRERCYGTTRLSFYQEEGVAS
jgi:16S rRNA (guanine966-N2)-methyltransferase